MIEIECLAGTGQNEVFSGAYMPQASLPYSVLKWKFTEYRYLYIFR